MLEELVRRFEPLARSVARRYHSRGEPLDDLTQVAKVGLLKAIAKFDPSNGLRLHQLRDPDHARRAQALLPRQRLGGARPARRQGTRGGAGQGHRGAVHASWAAPRR